MLTIVAAKNWKQKLIHSPPTTSVVPTSVLRNKVISNKQYVDQVLADTNIISETSKLNAKTELLGK